MVAISASVHPASARRVTAVPRRSLKVTPTMPAAAHAFRQEDRNPSGVHGSPSLFNRIGPALPRLASSAAFSGAPRGICTLAPVFDCWSGSPCRHIVSKPAARDRLGAARSIAQESAANADASVRWQGRRLRQSLSRQIPPGCHDRAARRVRRDLRYQTPAVRPGQNAG